MPIDDRYRILGMSDSPNVITGYANQSRELFTRLQEDPQFELYFLGMQFAGQPTDYLKMENGPLLKFKMLPVGMRQFGEDSLPAYVKKYSPDLIWCLLDTFMVQWMINYDWSPAKFLMYFPSDGFPLPANSDKLLRKANYRVAMSKFAQAQAIDAGLDCDYVPHGVNTNVFYPLNEKQKELTRAKWSQRLGIDLQNKFVIGAVGRMQGRKFHPELFKAVEKFAKDKNDVVLLMHCDPNDPANPGLNLEHLLHLRKINHLTRFTGMSFTNGFCEEELRELYSLFDVHALTTSGEGWGIPTIEAMACEVPNIITDFTTTKEIVTDNNAGIPVPLKTTITGTYDVERGIVDVEKFTEALQKLYDDENLKKELGQNGRKACLKLYDWEKVVYPAWHAELKKVLEK